MYTQFRAQNSFQDKEDERARGGSPKHGAPFILFVPGHILNLEQTNFGAGPTLIPWQNSILDHPFKTSAFFRGEGVKNWLNMPKDSGKKNCQQEGVGVK